MSGEVQHETLCRRGGGIFNE